MSVVIKDIKDTECTLFDKNDIEIGKITSEIQLNDVRIQIMEEGVYGYYIIWSDVRIDIDFKGNLKNWPNGFYDIKENQCIKLIGW